MSDRESNVGLNEPSVGLAQYSGCPRCLSDLKEEEHGMFFKYYCQECKAYRWIKSKEEG